MTQGYSLIEMMIVVVVMGILLAIAVPSAEEWITNMRMTSQVNDMVADVLLARSEAGSRGVAVTLCPSSDTTTCTASNDWASGRIVTASNLDGTTTVIRVGQMLTGSSSLVSMSGDATPVAINSFTFSSLGALSPLGSGGATLELCPRAGSSVRQGRRIFLDASGRPNVMRIACP